MKEPDFPSTDKNSINIIINNFYVGKELMSFENKFFSFIRIFIVLVSLFLMLYSIYLFFRQGKLDTYSISILFFGVFFYFLPFIIKIGFKFFNIELDHNSGLNMN
jgi:hypothetical protein